jgi:hypothetical protein
MNAQERLAYLLESVWVPTNKQVLFADITGAVGLEATALVVGTMKAASAANPLMDTIIIAMSTVGLSLSSPERQGVIDSLAIAGEWPDAVRDAVKALGGVWRTRWQSEGYENKPTLAAATRDVLRDQIKAKTTAMVGWLDALDVSAMTVEQVEAYAADLLASEDGNPSEGGE